MGIKDTRSNIKHGKYSSVLVLPANLAKGKKSTLAANRLLLIDPQGKIDENNLLEFLEERVEPQFYLWYKEQKITS